MLRGVQLLFSLLLALITAEVGLRLYGRAPLRVPPRAINPNFRWTLRSAGYIGLEFISFKERAVSPPL